MPTRLISVCVALALVLMAAFMVVADGMTLRKVWLATSDAIAMTGATHPAGTHGDE